MHTRHTVAHGRGSLRHLHLSLRGGARGSESRRGSARRGAFLILSQTRRIPHASHRIPPPPRNPRTSLQAWSARRCCSAHRHCRLMAASTPKEPRCWPTCPGVEAYGQQPWPPPLPTAAPDRLTGAPWHLPTAGCRNGAAARQRPAAGPAASGRRPRGVAVGSPPQAATATAA